MGGRRGEVNEMEEKDEERQILEEIRCVNSKLVKGRVGCERGQRLAGTPAAWVQRRQPGEQEARTASWRGQRAGQSER